MRIVVAETGNVQVPDFRLHRESGRNDYLFVHFRSPAMLLVEGEYIPVDKGVCVFFDKHKIQSYYGCGPDVFFHDYMHFELTDELEEVLFFDIPKGEPLYLTAPQQITEALAELSREHNGFSRYRTELMNSLGRVFLYRIKEQIMSPGTQTGRREVFQRLYQLRTQIYLAPHRDWTVEEMCRQVCMSRSYFQHLYKSFFRISCIGDVIRARISMAKKLLLSSDARISEIAEKCGYHSTEHFIRQFRKVTGGSPEQFRR